MSNLPSLPVVQANLSQASHRFSLTSTARWQTFPVPLRALEKVTIQLAGEIVYHYREWTTSGACGKKKRHVEPLKCKPNSDFGHGRFGLGDADTAEPFAPFPGECRGSLPVAISEDQMAGRLEGRLVGVIRDCLNGNGGDNQGAYDLAVAVESGARADRLLQEIETLRTQFGDPLNSPYKGLTVGTAVAAQAVAIARHVLRWETPRIILDSDRQRRFCKALTDLGQAILDQNHLLDGEGKKIAAAQVPWAELASWLGEWSVTESAGGRQTHAEGWVLRGEVAARRGDLTFAQELFVKALDLADPQPLLYKLAKLQEMRGVFFSPREAEVTTVEEAKLAFAAKEKSLEIGATDLYAVSLNAGSGQTKVDAGNATTPMNGGRLRLLQLKSYDTHYALGRLNFLRHTTSSLQTAAEHFRQCRRFARYRALTQPSLLQTYTLAMLLADARRSHPNPFHTGGRVAAPDYRAVAALRKVRASVKLVANLPDQSTGGFDQPDIPEREFKEFSWLSLNGPDPRTLPEMKDNLHETLWAKVPAARIARANAYILAQLGGQSLKDALGIDSIADVPLTMARDFHTTFTRDAESTTQDGSRRGLPPVLHWLQNPFYWAEWAIFRGSAAALHHSGPLAAVDWQNVRLTGVEESGEFVSFVFGTITVECRLLAGRPQIHRLTFLDHNATTYDPAVGAPAKREIVFFYKAARRLGETGLLTGANSSESRLEKVVGTP